MNLLDLAVKITCDDQASGEVGKIGDGIKNTLGTAAKVGGAAVAALGTATVAIGKTALDAFSNYEQLVGGIDTLFKDSSGKMQQYAANAYQTAGVSANRYMEISTNFAAALISSLGGNTEAAADMANTAIMDMSDNANKMGTSLDTVQEAYMSLSRGNYEMLDSLKLGYGGTKSELERLLSDAEKLSAAQGEVRDFSVDSYSDIVEAIHLVQDEMGITGTTADEAATTIEGSVNMAKAAWENWVTELGKDDADMEARTDELIDSMASAASNIVPRLATIVSTTIEQLPGIVTTLAPVVSQAFVGIFTQALDSAAAAVPGPMGDIISAVSDGVGEIGERFKGLGEIWAVGDNPLESLHLAMVYGLTLLDSDLSTLQENITSSLPGIAEGFANVGGEIIPKLAEGIEMGLSFLSETASSLMTSLGGYLSENLPSIMESGLQILTGLSESIVDNAGTLTEGAANLIVGLAQGIADSLPTIIEQAPVIVQNLADAINENAPTLLGAGLQAIATLAMGIVQAIPTLIANIPAIFSAFLAVWSALDWINLGSTAITFLGNGITGMIGFVTSSASNILSAIRSAIANLPTTLAEIGRNGISSLGSAIQNAISFATTAAASVGNSIVSTLASIPNRVVSIGSQIIQGMVNGVSEAAGSLIDSVKGAVDDAIQAAKNLLGIKSPSRVFRQIGRYTMQGAALGVDDDADLLLQSTDNAMRNMVSSAAEYNTPVTTFDNMPLSALIDEVKQLREDIKGMKIYLNGRTLVGGIADDMDRELGRRAVWSATM